jgi:hypothetical protein
MNATRKRLQHLESLPGESDEQFLRVEFYDLSPEGEEIRLGHPHLTAYDRPKSAQRMRCARYGKTKRTLQVVFVDSDGNGRPGPRTLAWERRRKLAGEKAAT